MTLPTHSHVFTLHVQTEEEKLSVHGAEFKSPKQQNEILNFTFYILEIQTNTKCIQRLFTEEDRYQKVLSILLGIASMTSLPLDLQMREFMCNMEKGDKNFFDHYFNKY